MEIHVVGMEDDDKVRGGKPPYNPLETIRLEVERRNFQNNRDFWDKFFAESQTSWIGKPIITGTGGECSDLSEYFYNPSKLCDEYKNAILVEEKDKYYVPTIDEFFVGFEFEFLYQEYTYPVKLKGEPTFKTEWKKAEYTSSFFGYPDEDEVDGVGDNLDVYVELKQVRVKRLDQIDLEEIGFLSAEKEHVFKHKNWTIRVVNWCHVNGAAMYISEYLDAANVNLVFKGFIRNKSELIKMLKMVGYGS